MITASVTETISAPQPNLIIGPSTNWPSVGGKIAPTSAMIWRARGIGSVGNSSEPTAPRRSPSCSAGTLSERLIPTSPPTPLR